MKYDLIIIGGAPAGVSAAVYAARKRLKTLVIAEEVGGQSAVSDTIYNWIGTPEISGADLAKNLKTHMEYYTKDGNTLTLALGQRAETVSGTDGFTVTTAKDSYSAKSVLIATGSRYRQLDVPGAAEYEHKGILYCATCDGPLFTGQPMAVIGGGNAAFESVLQLAEYGSHITLLHRSNEFRADEITIEKVKALPNVTILTNVTLTGITGTEFVGGLTYKNNLSTSSGPSVEESLAVNAVFVEIGQLPNTELAKDVVTLNEYKKIVVDPTNQRTSMLGIWAAGDCTNGLYHQNNIAAGDAVKAVEDLYIWLKKTS